MPGRTTRLAARGSGHGKSVELVRSSSEDRSSGYGHIESPVKGRVIVLAHAGNLYFKYPRLA